MLGTGATLAVALPPWRNCDLSLEGVARGAGWENPRPRGE